MGGSAICMMQLLYIETITSSIYFVSDLLCWPNNVDESQDSELNQCHREFVSYLRHIMTGRRHDQGLSRRRNASLGFACLSDPTTQLHAACACSVKNTL